ncbi:hypothetical protein [Hahella ganghwensis]|uniref:hypothetical protein n=1 Tax=Hahella ganghwensis TaxID=286420 RepID=UPI000362AABA|nr:hypothetical protein [Hahella ganghwensis]
MKRTKNSKLPYEPMRHPDHRRPVTRRELISQGFLGGTAAAVGISPLASLFFSRNASADPIDLDIDHLISTCKLDGESTRIPFICFDLAGGANIAGSNVLMGGQGGQEDVLSTAGYNKLGLPGDRTPSPGGDDPSTNFINTEFGLRFHNESAMLRGMKGSVSGTMTAGTVNGMIIAARSENDTANNPHNPLYGIAKAGAQGRLLTLIGTQTSDSGGNSMSPGYLIDPTLRPTKISRRSDATGLVDTGKLAELLDQDNNSPENAARVMRTMYRLAELQIGLSAHDGESIDVKNQIRCGYAKSANNVNEFGQLSALDPRADLRITTSVGGSKPIFTESELDSNSEFERTATVMKLVIDGLAGAGSVTLGGFDYHTGERTRGESRDESAGRCIGACLEYAKRAGKPVMIYVFSDGSVSSNGRIDMQPDAQGKPEWTSDNQSTASSFILVYNPSGVTSIRNQLGYMSSDGSVVTSSSPAANSVNQLVNTVILNYMALNGEINQFSNLYSTLGVDHGLGSSMSALESLVGMSI